MDRVRRLLLTVLATALSLVATPTPAADALPETRRRGTRFFVRALGAQTNAPILPKTRSAWTQDKQTRVGTTGMSDLGFTEYPFCFGRMEFSFVEQHAFYPRLISGAQADEQIVNTADVLAEHVYQPDGCVWGRTGRTFVQTFTATQAELVSVTLLVASQSGKFRVALVEGGPGGPQVGPAKTFRSGSSMTWGTARWTAGQAPLVPGRTYGIRIERTDGRPWSPYLHATGNAYDGGLLVVDDRSYPESDLAVWIVQQPGELARALIDGADPHGWVYNRKAVAFLPRSKNVRLISLSVAPVTDEDLRGGYCDLVVRVRSADGKLLAGPKRCLAVGDKGSPQTAHFLFATDELPVVPGRRYSIDCYTVPHKQAQLPSDGDRLIAPRDMQARVYGEPQPGAMPAIFNLSVAAETDSRLEFRWSEPFACPTRIESWGPGVNGGKRWDIEPGVTRTVIGKFWAGHEYDLRLTSTGPTGLEWATPLYRARMPRVDITPLLQETYPRGFISLAPPHRSTAPEYGPLRYWRQVPVVNHDFEEGLSGWELSGDAKIYTAPSEHDVGVKWGKQMAGWSHLAGEQRRQVLAESSLSQKIATTPGHVYVLSAWAHTSVAGGPRGDTRVRLFADPAGGDDIDGSNASQWYWTDARWMRFQHRFTADAEQATIGLALFRWRDLDRASAYVDHVTVWDLGPAPAAPQDPAPRSGTPPSLALVDAKVDAADKVEAQLAAPPGYVITGIGSRAHYDNVTTMWLRIQPLLADSTLGEPEQLRAGWEPDAGLEAEVALPPGLIATGFGAAVAPEWDVKRFRVWARPLLKDGTLGKEQEFRGGVDRESGVEKQVIAAPGRVLISAGLNCMHNDINGIHARSAALVRTKVEE